MSNRFEILDYMEIEGEKHEAIVTVRITQAVIVVRYKIFQKKDGSGYFAAPGAFKLKEDGHERYINDFELDSRYDDSEVQKLIREKVKEKKFKEKSVLNVPQPIKEVKTVVNDDEVPF